nr:Retrovirus-related Pol polyprotein from transposon TNT 1-94 [Ipomoea batatas]
MDQKFHFFISTRKAPFNATIAKNLGIKKQHVGQSKRDEATKANIVEKDVRRDDEPETLFVVHFPQNTDNDVWFIDSGCSNHMSNSRSLFENLNVSQKSEVRLGDDKKVQVDGKGTIAICTSNSKKKLLHDVFFVPSLAHNLLSVGQLMDNGLVILFDDGNRALVVKGCSDSDLWHLRYGHLHLNGLKLLSKKQMVLGLPNINTLEFCEGCVLGKHRKKPFSVGKSWRASECLELVHADLCGPMKTESLNGSRYFLLFTDDYTRMSWVYFLTLKSEALDMFKKFKTFVEKQSGFSIKKLRTDNGGWAEAIATTLYLRNISPTKLIGNTTFSPESTPES